MAEPRGIGFADEAEKASDYIVSGISGQFAICMGLPTAGQAASAESSYISERNFAFVSLSAGNYEESLENSPAAVKEYSRYGILLGL